MLLLFVVLLLIGAPMAFALGLSGLAFLLGRPEIPLLAIPQRIFAGMDSFTMLAVPLYILAGEFMETGGISQRLIRLASVLVGHIRGGFGMITVVATIFFSGISGSSAADTAAIGSVMIPAMRRHGYTPGQATAIVTAAGGMGILIPPCIAMVVLGGVANLSIGTLFIAGFIPGVLMGLALMGFIYAQARHVDAERRTWPGWREVGRALLDSALALFTPLLILGGILLGVFTATEAAVVAVVYSFIVSVFVYREMNWKDVWGALVRTGNTSAVVMLLIGAASLFSWIMARERIPQALAQGLLSLGGGKIGFLLLVNLVFLVIGSVLEGAPAIIILVPLLMPIAQRLGIDPIHFGVMLIANIGVGFALPPTGLCLLVAASTARVRVTEVVRPLAPYLGVMALTLLVITYVPWFTLILPKVAGLYGR